MGITKSTRFEVFKRDCFTCQYCGHAAPEVVLEVDHIHPRSKGGGDELLNLVASCFDCNRGKGARELSDAAVVTRQHQQLAELQERREQLEMLVAWRRGLRTIDDEAVDALASYWEDHAPGWSLTETGLQGLRKLLQRFDAGEVMTAMDIAATQYLDLDESGKASQQSFELAVRRLSGICWTRRQQRDRPYLLDLYYVRGILRKRCYYVDEARVMRELEEAVLAGIDVQELKALARTCSSWTDFWGGVARC